MEAEKIKNWNRTTEAIYKNVLLYSIAGICASVFNMVPGLGWFVDMFNFCVVAGFIAFFIRIKDMAVLVDDADAAAAKKLSNGVLVYILSLILGEIIGIGWLLGPIAVIVSCVLMLLGYSALKKSETFPGKDGMKMLFIAMILGIIGGVFDIIPGIGAIIGGIFYIIEFVMVLLGWKKVATPVAE